MKKVVIWVLAALLVQFGTYEYLGRVVFAPSASFTEHAAGGIKTRDAGPDASFSYDKAYYAVLSAWDLQIFAAKDNRPVINVSLKDNQTVSYFTWLPDRNVALVGLCSDYTYSTTATLLAINPATDSRPVTPTITPLARGARIVSVAFSTQTNVTNILVHDRFGSTVWRTDANNYLRRLDLGTSHIDRIASLRDQDVLLFDDTVLSSVYARYTGGRTIRLQLPGERRVTLIGTDKNDNIYLGALNSGGLVAAIFEGKIGVAFGELQRLASPVPPDLVHVGYDGTLSTDWHPPAILDSQLNKKVRPAPEPQPTVRPRKAPGGGEETRNIESHLHPPAPSDHGGGNSE